MQESTARLVHRPPAVRVGLIFFRFFLVLVRSGCNGKIDSEMLDIQPRDLYDFCHVIDVNVILDLRIESLLDKRILITWKLFPVFDWSLLLFA